MGRQGLILAAASALAWGVSHAAPPAPRADPSAYLRAIAASAPAAYGIAVERLRIDLGPAHLTIAKGTLVPVVGPAGRPQELLVLGEARFALATEDPVESYQIELFTGERSVDLAVSRAVLVIPNEEVADALVARPGRFALPAAVSAEAQDLLESWRASPEYRRAGVELTLLEDAASEPAARRAFVAWCHTPRRGPFLYTVDPYEVEQVRLQRFVAIRLGAHDLERFRRGLRREEEEGRFLGRRVEDFGDWDTWYSSSLQRPGGESFEPERYELELTVEPNLEEVRGVARIRLTRRAKEARVAHFELFDDLLLDQVSDASGRAVPWARTGSTIAAFLPAAEEGERLELTLRYHGVLYRKLDPGLRERRSSRYWYPRIGTIDRATYRAEFDAPESVRILASGIRVEESVRAGRRHQTRTLDVPTRFFGFEVGRYDIETRRIGHVALEIGFLRDAPLSEQHDREAVVRVVSDALNIYEQAFGPYPLDVLTVAATWNTVSRGYLSFLTLAQPIVDSVGLDRPHALEAAGTIAHELAHQWWGNMVGWTSYRDQWLSEALADYASALYRKSRAVGEGDLFPRPALVDAWTDAGRPVEAMGPVTLGLRLSSSLSREAYRSIVYDKGSMVFAMLADKLGEGPLLGMLREVAQRSNHRDIDTATFLLALERMSGQDLDAFAKAFVYGVGYPELHFDYAFAAGPPLRVDGTILQIPRGYRRDRLVRLGEGAFDVEPAFRIYQDVGDAQVDVAALVSFVDAEGAASAPPLRAVVPARGDSTPFGIETASAPTRLRLDPRRAIPAPVRDATLDRKRALERRGAALRSAGRIPEAIAALREVLETSLTILPEESTFATKGNVAWWSDRLDGRVHVALAEIALDEGRVGDAESELKQREVRIAADAEEGVDLRRKILRARLALRARDPKAAYAILRDVLALDLVQRESDTVGDALRREKFRYQHEGRGGDYLLLALSAHLTDRTRVAREAAAEAARRGADTTLLDEMLRDPS